MLLGWWDVALRTIGQLDVHRGLEGALRFDLQAGDREHLIGNRCDAQLANPNGLKLQLSPGLL
jgi:hypothetical protein